jgi:TetR/AcrR family transcriptional regulator, tetracycline repressor protein
VVTDDPGRTPDEPHDEPRVERPGRTPRGTLSRQVLLDAAMEIVDIAGVGALSMRALGARLGVDPTAVYRHFRTKNELLETLADVVLRGEPAEDGDASAARDEARPDSGDARADIRASFGQLRRSLLRHPTLAPLVLRRPPSGQATWERADHTIGLLRRAGMAERDAAAVYQTLLFFTLGHALTEARHTATAIAKHGPDAAPARLPPIDPPPDRYPDLAAVAPHLRASMDAQFDRGLDLLLATLPL